MKEYPILFSTLMVQAYMMNLKTQTRRQRGLAKVNINPDRWEFFKMEDSATGYFASFRDKLSGQTFKMAKSPYGRPGDVLWMREAYTVLEPEHCMGGMPSRFVYKADGNGDTEELRKEYVRIGYPYQWKPSIHMPKIACRNRMTVMDIYPQRLQDISEEDAIAEGVGAGFRMNAGWPDYEHIENGVCTLTQDTPRLSYWSLFDSLNGKGSWDKNPWVWRIEFKPIL